MSIKKVVITGPESTGKSTLSRQLATYYKAQWVPEFARQYLQTNGKDYKYHDLEAIAAGQVKLEDEIFSIVAKQDKNSLVFLDTNLYVIKTWSEFAFNDCENSILKQIAEREYHLYLLCDTDLEWENDDLREYPDLKSRRILYHHYREDLIEQKVSWAEISGDKEERLKASIKVIDELFPEARSVL